MTVPPIRFLSLTIACVVLPAVSAAEPRPGDEIVVRGTIIDVDVDVTRVTVRDPERGRVRFEVPANAAIRLDGEDGARCEDLYAGDVVVHARLRLSNGERWYLVNAVVDSTPDDPQTSDGRASQRARDGLETESAISRRSTSAISLANSRNLP